MRTVLLATLLALLSAPADAAEENPAPFGLDKRIPWTTSRLVGSPDPPLPYTVEKVFPNLALPAPIYIADEPGSDYLLVVLHGKDAEHSSRVVRFKNDQATSEAAPFFELPGWLIYSICFDPSYATTGLIYVFSNGPTSEMSRKDRISRFKVDRQGTPHIDPKSEELIIEWSSAGHDGGDMAFGRDGMFYLTTGDGSGDSDTFNSGQTLDDLLGAVLRIDVRGRGEARPYRVPPDNPFVKTPGACPEIWAYGLRNPWRMSIDPKTGHVWVGNNGQDLWETAHLVRAGENYGWSVYEGSHPFYMERRRGPTPLVPPTIEHSHSEFRSLTGGVVYYGDKFPDLVGAYIYGDYTRGRIWGMKHDGRQVIWHRELADTTLGITAFRVDHGGELLVADYVGGIYRLVPAPPREQTAPFPKRLSETGLFADIASHRVDPALIPYSVNVPGWCDGARAERFMGLAGESQINYHSAGSWSFPDGAALVQTLSLERKQGDPASQFRVETRVLVRQQGEWAGYSYRWNKQQTDATLVAGEGANAELAIEDNEKGGTRTQTWRFPARAECMTCHSRAAAFVLGLTEAQLNRDHDYGSIRDNQLRALDHIDIFTERLKPPSTLSRLADPYDAKNDLEARVRSYLHVNCSVCHVSAGGGNSKMELGIATSREKMSLLQARPQHDTFGIADAMLVAPSDPRRSVLVRRLSQRGRGQMPPLAISRVDERAVQLMTDWIAGMKPDKPIVGQWKMTDFPAIEQVNAGRSVESGQRAFRETGCAQCHRFGGEGGLVGPDLTNIGKRLTPQNLLESILLPSKTIADEYATFIVETEDGKIVSGRVEREDIQFLVLRPASSNEPPIKIEKTQIVERQRSNTSNMPSGTVNVLQKEEVLDLIGYLLAPAKE